MLGGLQRVFGRYVVVNEAMSAARWRGAPRSEVQGVGSSFVGCDAEGLERPACRGRADTGRWQVRRCHLDVDAWGGRWGGRGSAEEVGARAVRSGGGDARGDPVTVELRPGVVAGACGVRRAHVLVAEALLEAVPYGGQDGFWAEGGCMALYDVWRVWLYGCMRCMRCIRCIA